MPRTRTLSFVGNPAGLCQTFGQGEDGSTGGSDEFGEREADYYGGTVALTMITPYDVTGSDKTDRITFATTVGLHYAYGTGPTTGLVFDFDGETSGETRRNFVGHDLPIFAGSSVSF